MLDINISVVGMSALLMHNVRLADPLDEHTKALAEETANARRMKTEAARIAAQRAEWLGGLYYDPEMGIHMPSSWLLGALAEGGVIYGRKGKAVKQSVVLKDMNLPLLHDGPSDLEQLWSDPRYRDVRAVGVQRAKVMRTRPKFPKWAVSADAWLDDDVLDLAVLRVIADKAGTLTGIGDYRPSTGGGPFGRFKATIEPR